MSIDAEEVMFKNNRYDAVIIGSGPNGLSAGISLAMQGCSVVIVESSDTAGGGVRSEELTLPRFIHDPCASIFPLSIVSPFFRTLPLEQFGLKWIHSPLVLAHPLDGDRAITVERSLECTASMLGMDAESYSGMLRPLLTDWDEFSQDLLRPLPIPPKSLLTYLRFSLNAIQPASFLGGRLFKTEAGRALFAGMAGHSMMPLERIASGAFGVILSLTSHAVGWPFPQGGAGMLSRALIAYFLSLGGELVTNFRVERLEDLPEHRVALFDVAPRNLLKIVGDRFPASYQRTLSRYRYGPGVCKVDYALDGEVPWISEQAHRAATLHLGGSMEEIASAERQVSRGKLAEKPFVLVAQTSLFDPFRAPEGKHTLWAYCHVPNSSSADVSPAIEAQIERFAPGFKKRILSKRVRTAVEMETYNANYVGGDINSGVQDIFQQFTRPAPRLDPYSTPIQNIFICSSATPPGGGAHGMCGYYAARSALRRL